MMNNRLFELRQRRSEILARITSQRDEVAMLGASWKTPLAIADQGLAVARFLRSHPVLTSSLIALAVVRQRGLVGLGKIIWRGWRLYRLAMSLTARVWRQP